jgi:hypothetical protein
MGGNRKGTTMKEMTAQEILDAIRSGLEETSRRFAKNQNEPPRPRATERQQGAGAEDLEERKEKAKP